MCNVVDLSIRVGIALLIGFSLPAEATAQTEGGSRPNFLLVLGDSQGDRGTIETPTGDYAPEVADYGDQLFLKLRKSFPSIELEKLACGGESTQTMIDGGEPCDWQSPQLERALDFLRQRSGQTGIVTVSLGGNDAVHCLEKQDLNCLIAVLPTMQANLQYAVDQLRNAAGPDTLIVGMTYYNPALALWLRGRPGRVLAGASNIAVASMNDTLRDAYLSSGAEVADVESLFRTRDFGRYQRVPINVVRVCQWTWACGPEQDTHPNVAGYRMIAGEFARMIDASYPLAD